MSTSANIPNIRRKSRRSMNPVAQYVLSLATCVISYYAYLKYAVPLIEQPSARTQDLSHQHARVPIPKIYKNGMIPLLPPQAWELGDCKTLITSTGTILFKEFLPQPDGKVKLSPFTLMTNVGETMLLKKDGNPETEQRVPLVLRTAEGALLKLNKPFTEAIQGDAEIQSARLLGEVDIYRPPSGPNKADVLHVLTQNVQINREQVYTLDTLDQPFLFSYGPHRGRGRNLIIDLIHDDDTVAGQKGFSNVSGIRRLELAYLDRLRIVPSNAKPTATNASTDQASGKLFGGQDAPLEVSCKGPCVLDFAAQTVSFSDDVLVKKISPDADSLTCQRLKIKFDKNPMASKSTNPSQRSSDPNGPKQELGIESLTAESRPTSNGPPGPPVVVNAISRPATITASRLTYDARTDLITGTAGPSSNGMVSMTTPDLQYKTQQLACKLATGPDDKKSLDSLSSSGPGQLLKLGKTPADEMFVHWTKSLNTARDPRDASIQTLQIKGDTHVQFQETSSIDAQRIDLKLKRTEKTKDSSTEFAVMEIVANEDVRISTPEVTGKTDRLIAEFPNPIKLKSHQVSRPRYQTGRSFQPATQSTATATPNSITPIRTTVNLDDGFRTNTNGLKSSRVQFANATSTQSLVGPNNANPKAGTKKVSTKHLNFSGQQVKISILDATKDSFAFENLIINGEVFVSQNVPEQPSLPNSLELQGDHLRIVPQAGDERFRLELSSSTGPANIKTPEFTINGQTIHMDQVDNKLWVEGPGKFSFVPNDKSPVQPRIGPANRGGFAQAAVGSHNAKKSDSKFDASWQGGMIFDGRKIYLERDVVSKTEQFDGSKRNVTQANCGQMSVALNRYVDFEQLKGNDRDGESKPTDVKPTELIFIDRVDSLNQVFGQVPVNPNFRSAPSLISNRIYGPQNKLMQQQTVSSKQVRVDPTSKNIFADGPGWVSTHDLRAPSSTSSSSNRSSKHPLAGMSQKNNDPTKPITFVRANFSDSMAIDSAKNQMTINGRVRTAYLQTDDWNTNPDPDQIPPNLQAQAVVLTSERLTLARWQPRDATEVTHELIASGNVRILGDTIDLFADRVSYNQGNDMLVVNGTNRTAARIRFREDKGVKRPWQEFTAEKFEYQIASQTINVNGVQKGEAIRID